MTNSWSNGLFCALLASACAGALGPEAFATESSPPRLDGLLQGNVDASADSLASPSVVSLAAVKELSDASGQLRVWLEEVLGAAGALTLSAAAVLAYRRKRRQRQHRLQNLYEITEMPASLTERQTPRYLPSNPYLESSTPELLYRQIENAAEASLEFGRVLGIIYFDLGPKPLGDFSDESREWEADRSELMEKLQKALRRTDHVTTLSDNEVVACIALLPGKTELTTIAGRLRKIGQNSVRFGKAFAPQAGLAIYPACGYRGEELIDYAKADFYSAKPSLTYTAPNALSFNDVAYPKP